MITSVTLVILAIISILLIAVLKKSTNENFAWRCEFIPPKDYYKDDSILGDNWVIARGAIKQGF